MRKPPVHNERSSATRTHLRHRLLFDPVDLLIHLRDGQRELTSREARLLVVGAQAERGRFGEAVGDIDDAVVKVDGAEDQDLGGFVLLGGLLAGSPPREEGRPYTELLD